MVTLAGDFAAIDGISAVTEHRPFRRGGN